VAIANAKTTTTETCADTRDRQQTTLFQWSFYIYIPQGSVATLLRCGGIFTNHFIANCRASVPVKEFLKSVNIWQRNGQYTKWNVFFLRHSVTDFDETYNVCSNDIVEAERLSIVIKLTVHRGLPRSTIAIWQLLLTCIQSHHPHTLSGLRPEVQWIQNVQIRLDPDWILRFSIRSDWIHRLCIQLDPTSLGFCITLLGQNGFWVMKLQLIFWLPLPRKSDGTLVNY